ncbi:general stress protein [Salinarimonas soli]|uniref:DUF1269 domain-containing protein n=1 Tax=Salinarimonas soli TaxID=1638099 RepID=A0A5B2VAP8_9HYPH|nr:general stress protein [Salinarimonas soli]KAA2236603.1 DUF1269 domain-containing protein [Salinarimonas soli]
MPDDDILIAVFKTHAGAHDAVRTLEAEGFPLARLSIVGRGVHSEEHPVGFVTADSRIESWGKTGALWGSLGGLLVGAALVTVPGVGPVLAAGPIAQVIATALAGGAVGGGASALGAAFGSLGLSHGHVVRYEAEIKADQYLVIAHMAAEDADIARRVLRRLNVAFEAA